MQTDIEKNFVVYIMKQTRDIHEQDVVAKDNELRRASFLLTASLSSDFHTFRDSVKP
jgi:hypothetical protein